MRIFGTLNAVDESTRSVEILASTPNPVNGEALVSWDLERFLKNPVILWAHNDQALPVGRAENVRVDETGLKMRVVLASCQANPIAENIWHSILEKIVRSVSVGYEAGPGKTKVVEGERAKVRVGNELLEVSFVPVPADEDAGTMAETELRERRSNAAAMLATRAKRTDANDETIARRLDAGGRLGKAERTSLGGAKIAARFTRTGVLNYRNQDGTQRRELRLPEEVFHPDSLRSLEDVPVIDIDDHRDIHTPENYRSVARGHVKSFRRDGKYVAGEIVVQDGPMLGEIDKGNRLDISCGYVCKLDMTPGVFEGEAYDCVQREIRYNHVALCPPNRGRAGPDVGLRLDDNTWAIAHFDQEEIAMKMIRLDGVDYEVGSELHLAKIDVIHAAKLADVQKRLDEAEGEKDGAKEESRKLREEMGDSKKKDDEERKQREEAEEKRIHNRVRLYRTALRLLDTGEEDGRAEGGEEDGKKKKDDEESPESSDDDKRSKRGKRDEDIEKKMDGMSDREIMLMAITAHSKSFDGKEKSDDYVRSRFDALDESVRSNRGVGGVVRAAMFHETRLDANDDENDPVTKARAKRDAQMRDAWKGAKNGGK